MFSRISYGSKSSLLKKKLPTVSNPALENGWAISCKKYHIFLDMHFLSIAINNITSNFAQAKVCLLSIE
jgi:hypothetical protein